MVNLIARLQSSSSEAEVDHVRGSHQFANPMDDITVVVFHIKLQQNVRIRPEPSRHGAFQRDRFGFVSSVTVMSE
jgi:hypothetical protein